MNPTTIRFLACFILTSFPYLGTAQAHASEKLTREQVIDLVEAVVASY
ncbi:MAG: hypothetical protein RJA70_3374 [Pseudomonadota bacterium]|jgi:hypothetical protein